MPTSLNRPPAPQPLFLALEIEDFPAQAILAMENRSPGEAFVVVQQDAALQRSAVLACSPAARGKGIRAGMPVPAVQRRHPQVTVLRREQRWESRVREEMGRLFRDYTPEYEVDERAGAVLELTGTPALRAREPSAVARELRENLRYRIGLTSVALGIASTRLLARMLARLARPEGLRFCSPGEEAATLAPLSPQLLPGLSPACREKLKKYALDHIEQVHRLGLPRLKAHFGKEGEKLYSLCRGLEALPVSRAPRCAEAETVLEQDINDDGTLAHQVALTADKLCFRLRREGLLASHYTLRIRYTDHKVAQRSFALAEPTHAYMPLAREAEKAFRQAYQRRVGIKSLHLRAQRPEIGTGQLDLFDESWTKKQRAIGEAVERIRSRNRFEAIVSASHLES